MKVKSARVVKEYKEGINGSVQDGFFRLSRNCPECRAYSVLDVRLQPYRDWVGGRPIRLAFPDLNAGAKLWLVCGICEPCRIAVFS